MLILTVTTSSKSATKQEADGADHSEYGVGSTAGLVHFCFTKMPELFPAVQQLQDMLCTGHDVLTQASDIYATLFALVYLQLGLIGREQVMDLFIV